MIMMKIDNVDHDTEKLSDEAKARLVSLQFCNQDAGSGCTAGGGGGLADRNQLS